MKTISNFYLRFISEIYSALLVFRKAIPCVILYFLVMFKGIVINYCDDCTLAVYYSSQLINHWVRSMRNAKIESSLLSNTSCLRPN